MKILLIAYSFGGSASGRITSRVALEMAHQGHELVVVCAENNYEDSKLDNIVVYELPGVIGKTSIYENLRVKILTYVGLSAYNSHFFWRYRAFQKSCNVIKKFEPDLIYARSTPIDACLVGLKLHVKFNIPVYQHFSDPLPAPFMQDCTQTKRFIKQSKAIIEGSDLISFGTIQMADYIQSLIGYDNNNKIFEAPDVTVGSIDLNRSMKDKGSRLELVYLGNIYGSRNPQPLFQSLEILNNKGLNVHLSIYSSEQKLASSHVSFLGYTKDVNSALQNADVLVDIDGDDKIPVFVSSKLKDYLMISRPILSITPAKSPTRLLLQGLKSTMCVLNQVSEIKSAIESFYSKSWVEQDFNDRQELIDRFSPHSVVNLIFNNLNKIVHGDNK